MGLSNVFALIAREYGANTHFVGPDRKNDTDDLPRIRWNPVRAQTTGAKRIQGGPGDDGDVGRRGWTVSVEFWHATFDELEAMVDHFYAVCHDIGTHRTFPADVTEEWNTGGVTKHGMVCAATMPIFAPIKRTALPTVTPTPEHTHNTVVIGDP